MNVVNSQYAFTIYTGLNVDFLQLKNSLGQVTGWIDCNGNLGGTLGSTSSSFAQSAQLVIVGNSADDFLHLISGNVVAAWINSSGVLCNSGNPSVRAVKTIVAPTVASDLLVFSTNTLLNPQVVSWIDSFGNYNTQSSLIMNLQFSVTDTTVVATWTTTQPTYSLLFVGGKAAIDNGYQMSVTSHQAIVTGLTPSTVYECQVQSDGETALASVTTNPAQTRSVFSTASVGSVTETSADGDTLYNFVSSDNVTYICRDDSSSPGGSANMSLNKLTNETNLTIASVNIMSAFGTEASSNGTDGPGGSAMSYKQSGLFGMGGVLYMFETRTPYGSPQTQWYYNLLADNGNHGASWNNPQALTTYDANGNPPSPGVGMFADSTIGWVVPVRYAVDDGTLGYNTPGNQIDGANGFVYMVFTDGYWNNGSHLYLMRVPRVYIQIASHYQFWNGPSSPAASDFVNDANWSNTSSSKTAIYTSSGQTSAPDLVFVPARNCYLLLEWYQSPNGTASNTVWNIYSGPTPAGPWTEIMTQTFNPQGWYNPVVLHRTVATNTQTSNVQLGLACTGDYVGGAYYKASYATLTLN